MLLCLRPQSAVLKFSLPARWQASHGLIAGNQSLGVRWDRIDLNLSIHNNHDVSDLCTAYSACSWPFELPPGNRQVWVTFATWSARPFPVADGGN